MKIGDEELGRFLVAAHRAIYASQTAPKASLLRSKSQDYDYEEVEEGLGYRYARIGSRAFIAQEIVYQNGLGVWGMNCHGYVLTKLPAEDAHAVLFPALRQPCKDILPVRGPRVFRIPGKGTYRNTVTGTLKRFSGTEEIFLGDRTVYRCLYHGGSIL